MFTHGGGVQFLGPFETAEKTLERNSISLTPITSSPQCLPSTAGSRSTTTHPNSPEGEGAWGRMPAGWEQQRLDKIHLHRFRQSGPIQSMKDDHVSFSDSCFASW